MSGKYGHKKKRGAQPGNANARKHGLYAAALTPEELSACLRAVNLEGTDPEIAVLRARLDAALRRGPTGPRLRRDAARLLSRCYRRCYRLDAAEYALIRKLIRSLVEAAAAQLDTRDETNRDRIPEHPEKTAERIEARLPVLASLLASER
jgi:hypothetical protein